MDRRTISIALGLSLLMAGAAAAQTGAPETFKFLSAKDVGALTDKPGTGPKTAHLAEHAGYDVEYALRGDTGNMVEVHAHTTHYIHILEGQGTLTYGGNVMGGKETAPGETRGSSVTGGTAVALHAGDYLQIPAGLPHLFNAAPGTKLRYLVFNIKA
jgi:mannose-6-phosphate isomerase-like protein (cupin superfamily)